jgi:type II secretory pathway pseudopilin PulG
MICRRSNLPAASQGYTFLEIALALGIIAVVFAAVLPMVSAGYQERRLTDGMESLGQCVRDARREAESTGREQTLVVEPGGLALREGSELVPKVRIPRGAVLSVRRPQGKWAAADSQEWRIFSCGLVAPASLRLQQGTAWIEADFDFLTGSVAAERYSF